MEHSRKNKKILTKKFGKRKLWSTYLIEEGF